MTQVYPIRLVRMLTGELIVTGIYDAGKGSYVFEKPMVLVVTPIGKPKNDPDQPQEYSVILRNWMEFTDDSYFIVNKQGVLTIMKPCKQLMSDYTHAKINSDIMDDMVENGMAHGKTVEDLESDEDDDLEIQPGEEDFYDEFPGWGGDPRLGS
jgi:hypothetical protein